MRNPTLLKNFSKIIILLSLIVGSSPPLKAGETPPFLRFARPLAMGDAFTAVADDFNLFYYNPAGLARNRKKSWVVAEVEGGISTDFKRSIEYISEHKDTITNWDELTPQQALDFEQGPLEEMSRMAPRFFAATNLVSYMSGPLEPDRLCTGFGIFGSASGVARLSDRANPFDDLPNELPSNNPSLNPTILVEVNQDVVVPLTMAWDLTAPSLMPGRLGLGLTTKWIRRYQIRRTDTDVEDVERFRIPPSARGDGFGTDVGMLYRPSARLTVGGAIQDAFGTKLRFKGLAAENGYPAQPSRRAVIKPRFNLGVALRPHHLFGSLTKDRVLLTFDLHDVANDETPFSLKEGSRFFPEQGFISKTHFGFEFRREIFRFRAGLSQGYPTIGIGCEDTVLALNYTLFSQRHWTYLGTSTRQTNHLISLGLRFGGSDFSLESLPARLREQETNGTVQETGAFYRGENYLSKESAKKSSRVHVVKPGETLASLARDYYGSIFFADKIRIANQHLLNDMSKLEPGTKIILPE